MFVFVMDVLSIVSSVINLISFKQQDKLKVSHQFHWKTKLCSLKKHDIHCIVNKSWHNIAKSSLYQKLCQCDESLTKPSWTENLDVLVRGWFFPIFGLMSEKSEFVAQFEKSADSSQLNA
jgi:hypothetical protein